MVAKEHTKHARQRFKQRIGVKLTQGRYAEITRLIRAGELPRIEKQPKKRYVYLWMHEGRGWKIVFDWRQGSIVTVMHATMPEVVRYGTPDRNKP